MILTYPHFLVVETVLGTYSGCDHFVTIAKNPVFTVLGVTKLPPNAHDNHQNQNPGQGGLAGRKDQ